MNKLAIITGFLGGVKNRFMVYQDDRALQQKFEMDYIKAYDHAAEAFVEGCAHNPDMRICKEPE